jgi:hypothetical protein
MNFDRLKRDSYNAQKALLGVFVSERVSHRHLDTKIDSGASCDQIEAFWSMFRGDFSGCIGIVTENRI